MLGFFGALITFSRDYNGGLLDLYGAQVTSGDDLERISALVSRAADIPGLTPLNSAKKPMTVKRFLELAVKLSSSRLKIDQPHDFP